MLKFRGRVKKKEERSRHGQKLESQTICPPPTPVYPLSRDTRSFSALRPIANASSVPSASRAAGRLSPACVGRGCSSPDPPLVGGGGGGRDWRVVLPAGEALRGAGVRRFGVVDSVQDKIINRNAAKQGEKELDAS